MIAKPSRAASWLAILLSAMLLSGCGGKAEKKPTSTNQGAAQPAPSGDTGAQPPAATNQPALKKVDLPPSDVNKTGSSKLKLKMSSKPPVVSPNPAPQTAAAPPVHPMAAKSTTVETPETSPNKSATESTESPSAAAPPEDGQVLAMREMPAGAPKPESFTRVKVFYGTDRNAIVNAVAHPLGKIAWTTLALAAAGLTAVLFLVSCFARRTWLRALVGVSLAATIALGVCAYQIPRNTKPDEADASLAYGNDRGSLELGMCEVSIPKYHEIGQLESPSVLSLEFNEDPERHVVLLGVQRQDPEAFFDQLSRRIAESQRREAFVFVHGYNVTFENAARRTAQMAHDLHFDGAPIFYSWPSQGGLLQYTVDETNVVWTVPHLRDFLLDVAQKTGAQRVHLIAHSMGNRALTAALAGLANEGKLDKPLFHEVLLTAPDIDADVFRRDIVPAIVKTANRVTLYASSHDNALVASKKVHGYPRAGESGDNLIVMPGIDTIDVSEVDTSLLGHSYYGDSDTVLTDIAQLLAEEKPPSLRERLKTMKRNALDYWLFLAEKAGLHPATSEL